MTVYVDCTSTRQAFHQTGIQRVVRNILRHLAEAERRHGVAIVPVYLANRSFHRAECTRAGELLLVPADDPAATAREPLKVAYWRAMHAAARHAPGAALQKWLRAPAARDGLARVLSRVLHVLGVRRSALWRKDAAPEVVPGAGDVLIALDLDMHQGMGAAVRRARAGGARVVCVCYDLIPLSHPAGIPAEFLDAFRVWIDEVLAEADDVITISETVAADVRAHFARTGRPLRARSLRAFRLGHEMDVAGGNVRPEFRAQFAQDAGGAVFLTVGWIDTRKNQQVAIEALRLLAAQGVDARLVVVGKRGPPTDTVLGWLHRQPELAARVHVWHDASDAEVDYGYRHCAAVICPSLVEGFGLPLVEALMRGAAVFASDIPVFREVAAGHAVHFDPRDAADLARRLAAFVRERGGNPVRAAAPQWPGWRESAREFFDLALGAPAAC